MYKVIRYFTDLQDGNYPYNDGDVYPREGLAVSADRIKELSSSANLRGVALIEEVRGKDEAETISKKETVETVPVAIAAERSQGEADPVEDEPKKRGRKRKDND